MKNNNLINKIILGDSLKILSTIKDNSIDVMHEYTSVTLTFIDMEPLVQIIVTNHEKTVKIHNHQCHFDGTIDKLGKALELVLTLYHK